MPHYKNGQAAVIGDLVRGRVDGGDVEGFVLRIYPGTDTCNLVVGTTKRQTGTEGDAAIWSDANEIVLGNASAFNQVAAL